MKGGKGAGWEGEKGAGEEEWRWDGMGQGRPTRAVIR